MRGLLPQYFADEFGWPRWSRPWPAFITRFRRKSVPKTAILAHNYGGAGAIDFFGPRYGLPKSISPHQNYYYWGPRQYTGESLILLEWDLEDAQRWCGSVDQGPTVAPYYGLEWEQYAILIRHNFKPPLIEPGPSSSTGTNIGALVRTTIESRFRSDLLRNRPGTGHQTAAKTGTD
jgi:hypothetical protein